MGQKSCTLVQNSPKVQNSPENQRLSGEFGAGGVTCTPDLLITNQLLYRLSYTSIWGTAGDAAIQRSYYTTTFPARQGGRGPPWKTFSITVSNFAGKLAGYGADIQTPGPFRPYSTAFDRRTGPTGGENLLQNTKFFVHRRLGSPSLFSAHFRQEVSHKWSGNFSVQGVIHSFHTVFNRASACYRQEVRRFPQVSCASPAESPQVLHHSRIYITPKYTSIHDFPRFPARKSPGTCKEKKGGASAPPHSSRFA